MPAPADFLAALSEKRVREVSAVRIRSSLDTAARRARRDVEALIRFHERLLFLVAYPPSLSVRRRAEALLERVPGWVEALEAAGEDIAAFDQPEVAGIAGTVVTTTFSFPKTRWLASRFPAVGVDWGAADEPDRLGEALPRFVPLLEEEASADANVNYREWLDAARGGSRDLPWLLARFAGLPGTDREQAELFDALALPIEWRLGRSRASRTFLRRPVRRVFGHPDRLLSGRDVSLEAQLSTPQLRIRPLSPREGEAMLDMARAATASRYREFYGFTHGDPETAVAARAERGLEIFLFGVRKPARLPLRAVHTAFVLKNGVPVAYFEGLSFFERMEAGFNVYYTFREGESAWIYANVLALCREALGVSSFSVDPYQIGLENEEAIASGAFWFYRKLGFRPTDPRVARLVATEEEKLARNPSYRTPARTLRRIATCNLLFEHREGRALPPTRDWDRFHIRRLGLAVNREMARQGGGSLELRNDGAVRILRALGAEARRFGGERRRPFEDWAVVLALVPHLDRWTRAEKDAVAGILAAKSGRAEAAYLRRMQRHARLRQALIRLGSRRSPTRE